MYNRSGAGGRGAGQDSGHKIESGLNQNRVRVEPIQGTGMQVITQQCIALQGWPRVSKVILG